VDHYSKEERGKDFHYSEIQGISARRFIRFGMNIREQTRFPLLVKILAFQKTVARRRALPD